MTFLLFIYNLIQYSGKSEYEDVLQCNNLPSSRTPRGHQAPAAFIILSSGLNKVLILFVVIAVPINYIVLFSMELMELCRCLIPIWISLDLRDLSLEFLQQLLCLLSLVITCHNFFSDKQVGNEYSLSSR